MKNKAPKIEITKDDTHRRDYILLIIKCLEWCKTHTANDLILNPADKKVTEYHLKKVAQRAVIEETSEDEYIAIFKGRLSRLIAGNEEEWLNTARLINRHKLLITSDKSEVIDSLYRFYFKKKTGALSEK